MHSGPDQKDAFFYFAADETARQEALDMAPDILGKFGILLLCDHASNFVPQWVNGGDLGIEPADLERHIAYDIGALGVARALAELFGADLLASNYSRLVIDPNRGEDDPTLIMQIYDGSIIPANRGLDDKERGERIERLYRPYHQEIARRLDHIKARGRIPLIIAIHSFTRQLMGREARPWHIGILSAEDRRIADPILAALRENKALLVGDNEPYHGALAGDTMDRHGINRGVLHALIEIRNDLIGTQAGQEEWAQLLHRAFLLVLEREGRTWL